VKTFEIKAPDGRIIRHRHESLEAAQKAVVAPYTVAGEVLGASADGSGGFLDPVGGPSLMATLLEKHPGELRAWLRDNMPTLDVRNRDGSLG
jgi:hypothetical protein